jgi:DNA end-binding protein Ku
MPSGPALVLNTLRWASEIQPLDMIDSFTEVAQSADLSESELSMATQLIGSMSHTWEPDRYHDTFRADIMALINQKIRTGNTEEAVDIPASPAIEMPIDNTIDLTDILRRSLLQSPPGAARRKSRPLYAPARTRRSAPAKSRRTSG